MGARRCRPGGLPVSDGGEERDLLRSLGGVRRRGVFPEAGPDPPRRGRAGGQGGAWIRPVSLRELRLYPCDFPAKGGDLQRPGRWRCRGIGALGRKPGQTRRLTPDDSGASGKVRRLLRPSAGGESGLRRTVLRRTVAPGRRGERVSATGWLLHRKRPSRTSLRSLGDRMDHTQSVRHGRRDVWGPST